MTPLPTLRPYQAGAGRAIIDSVVNGRGLTFTVVMARQAGKNELSAQIELFLLLRNARIAIDAIKAAPTFNPQCEISMARLWSHVACCGLAPIASREDGRTVRVGHAGVVFLSAEPAANVVGHTAGLLLEIDEADVVRPLKLTSESKSNLGYELIAAVNGGRLRMYAPDGSIEHAESWRQIELARVAYRPSQQMNFYVDPAEGHDDYLVSLALTVHAASDPVPEPRIARGRIRVDTYGQSFSSVKRGGVGWGTHDLSPTASQLTPTN